MLAYRGRAVMSVVNRTSLRVGAKHKTKHSKVLRRRVDGQRGRSLRPHQKGCQALSENASAPCKMNQPGWVSRRHRGKPISGFNYQRNASPSRPLVIGKRSGKAPKPFSLRRRSFAQGFGAADRNAHARGRGAESLSAAYRSAGSGACASISVFRPRC